MFAKSLPPPRSLQTKNIQVLVIQQKKYPKSPTSTYKMNGMCSPLTDQFWEGTKKTFMSRWRKYTQSNEAKSMFTEQTLKITNLNAGMANFVPEKSVLIPLLCMPFPQQVLYATLACYQTEGQHWFEKQVLFCDEAQFTQDKINKWCICERPTDNRLKGPFVLE